MTRRLLTCTDCGGATGHHVTKSYFGENIRQNYECATCDETGYVELDSPLIDGRIMDHVDRTIDFSDSAMFALSVFFHERIAKDERDPERIKPPPHVLAERHNQDCAKRQRHSARLTFLERKKRGVEE